MTNFPLQLKLPIPQNVYLVWVLYIKKNDGQITATLSESINIKIKFLIKNVANLKFQCVLCYRIPETTRNIHCNLQGKTQYANLLGLAQFHSNIQRVFRFFDTSY